MSQWSIDKEGILAADKDFRRNLVNSLHGFKSLNLLGSISKEGKTNLAVFSQVFHLGASPPLLGIIFRPHTVTRHSLENILSRKHFTLNHVNEEQYVQAHHTSARWDQSEFDATGLEEEYIGDFPAPFVKGSQVQIACSFAEKHDIELNGTHLLIANIEAVHLADEQVLGGDGFLDLEAAGTLTLSGLDRYHKTEDLARLSYAKPNQAPKPIN